MTDGAAILSMLIAVVVAVLVILVVREVVCWYWKVNSVLKHLEEIVELLRRRDG